MLYSLPRIKQTIKMKNTPHKVYIETLGCQMNKSDSEMILGILGSIGYKNTINPKEADLLIINTCTIRSAAEDKAFSYLGVWGKMKKSKPEIVIAVCGCVAQQKKETLLKRAPYIDIIFGTQNINQLPELLKTFKTKGGSVCSIHSKPFETATNNYKPIRESKICAWLNIIEGCDYFCTYCVVPYVRGRQRSKDFNTVINETKELVNQGYKEITLLGQTVDSYGKDFGDPDISLSSLLRALNSISGLKRIRFVTSHPVDITDELIETVAELDNVCEYFHIPMQSGNTEILEKMKRGYTAQEYYQLINKIKAKIKNVSITSDFIVGFPGETEDQFQDTVKAVEELLFDQCNTAMYSPRKQTPAATWKEKQIPKEVKKQRINILNYQVKQSAFKSNEKFINTTQEVLVESSSYNDGKLILSGRTKNNKITHFESDLPLIGKFVKVKIVDTTPWSMRGILL